MEFDDDSAATKAADARAASKTTPGGILYALKYVLGEFMGQAAPGTKVDA